MKKVCFALLLFTMLGRSAAVYSAEPPPKFNLKVDTVNQLTYVYQLNAAWDYELLDIWATSTGAPSTSTPTGTYKLKPLSYGSDGEWYYFKTWACWVNYVTQFYGNCCFHSPPTNERYIYQKTPLGNIQQLLSAKSHGCIRLLPRQTAFIWYNMAGCEVEIFKGEVTEETDELRQKLLREIPTATDNYPDPIITEDTTFWYTYHGDTVEKICELTGLMRETLTALNPGIDLDADIQPGVMLLIKDDAAEYPSGYTDGNQIEEYRFRNITYNRCESDHSIQGETLEEY